jgi:hypothetical protein
MSDVPQGTVTEVLSWVDGDPGRAQQALDAENQGQQRATLISSLEAIAARKEEPAVSEETTTAEAEEVEEVPGPTPPSEVTIDPEERATVPGPVNLRDADVEAPETELEAASYEPVETFQVVAGGNGVVLFFNGEAVALNTQQALDLMRNLNGAVASLNY